MDDKAALEKLKKLMIREQRLEAKLRQLSKWLHNLADKAEQDAISYRNFPALAEATRKDGENYRATARDIDKTLATEAVKHG